MALTLQTFECSLCFEEYDELQRCPRLLQCGHTFCSLCLQSLWKDGSIECPLDRRALIAMEGVQSLPKNFSLMDIMMSNSLKLTPEPVLPFELCNDGAHDGTLCCPTSPRAKMLLTQSHSVVSVNEESKLVKCTLCPKHQEPFRYFDTECQCLICADCFVLKHSAHKSLSLDKAAVSQKDDLRSLCRHLQSRATDASFAKEEISRVLHGLEGNFRSSSKKVEDHFGQVSKPVMSKSVMRSILL